MSLEYKNNGFAHDSEECAQLAGKWWKLVEDFTDGDLSPVGDSIPSSFKLSSLKIP